MTPPSVPSHLDFKAGTMVRGRRIDHQIIRRLGEPGGYGVVYEAEDQHNREHVALKFLKEEPQGEDLNCLWREVGLGQTIDHPNVVWINSIGKTADNVTYISMELVSGEDLAKLLGRIKRLPPETAIAYAIELCQGLSAIHGKRVVHRDLKPANVMLDDRGHAKITDLGLAVPVALRVQTRGTPVYMAPEQLMGASPDTPADIYSLGLMLYELFTGERCLKSPHNAPIPTILAEHDVARTRRPSDVKRDLDPAIDRLIESCLLKEPRRRPEASGLEYLLRSL